MRKTVDQTTRFKLALIGIPLIECLALLAVTLLILFGDILSCGAKKAGDDAALAVPDGDAIVELRQRTAPESALSVSLTKNGVLLYSPVQKEAPSTTNLRLNAAQSIHRADIAALADFSNGSLPILNRDEDAITLSKLLYGEARGIDSEAEKAAIAWCVLNRVDDNRFPDTVSAVVTQRSQFSGYSPDHPVQSNLYLLSLDVLTRWRQGKAGGMTTGRVLPEGYCYFMGDGVRNYFAEDLGFLDIWDWSYPDPYPAIRRDRMQNYFLNEREVQMIANMMYGVSQGKNVPEKRAVVWCVLNRVRSNLFPDTVYEVIMERKQFPAYRDTNLLLDENLTIVREVVAQWHAEQCGASAEDVGRILPTNYLYFDGNGWRNYFSKTYPVRYGYVFIGDRKFLKARW